MGKAKKGRKFANGAKIGPLHSNRDPGDNLEENIEIGDDLLQKIANNLKSGSSIDKECGCSTLAMVAESKVEVILERKLARMAGPLMVDKDLSVSHAAVGALVNISMISHDVCDELVNQDVMTPLCKLIVNYTSELPNQWNIKDASNELKSLKEEIFIKTVTLMWNLCEASESALKILNSQNIVSLLLSYVDVEKYGIDVVACVLQCIYSVSENNIPAITAIKERGIETLFGQFFKQIADHNDSLNAKSGIKYGSASELYLRILACGITIAVLNEANTNGMIGLESDLSSQVLPILIKTASDILDQDQRKLINEYTSLAPISEEETDVSNSASTKNSNGNGESMEHESIDETLDENHLNNSMSNARLQLSSLCAEINHVLLGQQMTCEILTNLCCDANDNDSENWEDDSDEACSSDTEECNNVEDNSMTTANGMTSTNNIPTVILEAFVSNNLVSKVLAKANFPAENVCEMLREEKSKSQSKIDGQTILKMLSTLRSRAFLCVNNMLGSNLTVEDLGGAQALFSVWSNLGILCFQDTMKNGENSSTKTIPDQELLESATSAMRATTQKLFEAKCCDPFNAMCDTDVRRMIEFGSINPEANIRINMVQIIGNLGAMSTLPKVGQNLAQCSHIFAQFLLDTASKDVDIRVVAEALDKIFDMFAEDYTDELCVRVNLVSQLKKILPTLKIKIGLVKKGKRQEVEQCFLPVVNIAKTNLNRFIKYKESSK